MKRTTVDDKLYTVLFNVHKDHPHIKILDPDACMKCAKKYCLHACPAKCYTQEPDGRVSLNVDGCLECCTCRISCDEFNNLEWN